MQLCSEIPVGIHFSFYTTANMQVFLFRLQHTFFLARIDSRDKVARMSHKADRFRAVQMLLLATALWGLSFPTTKALAMMQQNLLPESNSWFLAALCIVY